MHALQLPKITPFVCRRDVCVFLPTSLSEVRYFSIRKIYLFIRQIAARLSVLGVYFCRQTKIIHMKVSYILISCVFLFVALLSHQSVAQCGVTNGDFNQINCTNCAAFNPITPGSTTSNVPNWVATHGTPNDNTWGGNHVGLGANIYTSEGIRTNYDFIVGHTYTITFQIKVDDPNNNYSNLNPGVTYVRAMNNGPLAQSTGSNWSHAMPALPAEQELITAIQSNASPYWLESWQTVQVQYTPTGTPANGRYTQLWLYYQDNTTSTNTTWSSIKNVQITEAAPTSSFHIQDNFLTNGTGTTILNECDNIVLNGFVSEREDKFYIDVWRKPFNSQSPYVWAGRYNTPNNGWTFTSVGLVDLTYTTGVNFVPGWDYRVKLAVGNDCHGWVESTQDFRIYKGGNAPAPEFHMERYLVGYPIQNFSACHEMWLVETGEANTGYNYDKWHLAMWERPIGSSVPFTWKGNYTYANGGWVNGHLPARLDLKTAFANSNNPIVGGKEYRVQLAMRNPCSGWVAAIETFNVELCSSSMRMANNDSSTNLNALTVAPNPSKDIIVPSIKEYQSFQIIDGMGRVVLTEDVKLDQIDIQSLPAGIYRLQLVLESGNTISANFVKQ